jgi:hypothetical protein
MIKVSSTNLCGYTAHVALAIMKAKSVARIRWTVTSARMVLERSVIAGTVSNFTFLECIEGFRADARARMRALANGGAR